MTVPVCIQNNVQVNMRISRNTKMLPVLDEVSVEGFYYATLC